VVADRVKVDERLVDGGWSVCLGGELGERRGVKVDRTDLMNFSVRRSEMIRFAGSSASMLARRVKRVVTRRVRDGRRGERAVVDQLAAGDIIQGSTHWQGWAGGRKKGRR
jgi:hypothetical protein